MAEPIQGVHTLTDVLQHHVRTIGDRPAYTLLHRVKQTRTLTYARLYELGKTCAGTLRAHGLEKGDRVLIILPTSEAFFGAYWGTILAGGVPVPIYPPVRFHRIRDYWTYMTTILNDCQARLIVADRNLTRLYDFPKRADVAFTVLTDDQLTEGPPLEHPVPVEPDDTALLQYTSGSTARPKGVQLYHRHLIANIVNIGLHIDIRPDDIGICWLPLYHDMGLIGMVLGALYWQVRLYVMSPLEFLRRPVFWLRAITAYRGTVSAGPNFAYSICAHKIRDIELHDLDLSSWRIALCGAEPILAETLERFAERFRPFGFRRGAFMPAYGLAENSLAVTLGRPGEGYTVDWVDRETFETQHRAVPTDRRDASALAWVACGVPIPNTEVRIVDDTGTVLPERHEGEIQVRSPSVMAGYYRNPEATASALRNGWLATGDLGYLADGMLFVTGRKKEIIIRGGRNYYPQDIERAVMHVDGVRKGGVIAFGVPEQEQGTERIVVVAEITEKRPEQWPRIEESIRRQVLHEVGIPIHEILLVAPGTIPKTSSGKLQRVQCKMMYLQGQVTPIRPEDIRRWRIPRPLKNVLDWIRYRLSKP